MIIGSPAANAAPIISSIRHRNFTKSAKCSCKSTLPRPDFPPSQQTLVTAEINCHIDRGTYSGSRALLEAFSRSGFVSFELLGELIFRTLRNSVHGPPPDDGGTR